MKNIELAKWLHDNYEDAAKEQNWDTQEKCKVEFESLPEANKQTMIEIAERILDFDLLRLHFVVGSFSKKDILNAYNQGFKDSVDV